MADNSRKTPLARSLHRLVEQKQTDYWWREGKGGPCSVVSVAGQIVTVSFQLTGTPSLPQVTVPIATWIYDWIPVRVGELGFVVSSDFYLGGVSGLGGGTAGLSQLGNLTNLVFVPISNSSWAAPPDPEMRVVQGPNGVLIQSIDGSVVGNFSKANGITLSFGGHSIVINSSGVTIDGILWNIHEHTGVSAGSANTGGPVAG